MDEAIIDVERRLRLQIAVRFNKLATTTGNGDLYHDCCVKWDLQEKGREVSGNSGTEQVGTTSRRNRRAYFSVSVIRVITCFSKNSEAIMGKTTEEVLSEAFICGHCKNKGAVVEKLAMSGVGISRLFDIQPHLYAFVSCDYCGYTEVFNLKILEGQDDPGRILDIIFSLD
jgi:uncharacterized protein